MFWGNISLFGRMATPNHIGDLKIFLLGNRSFSLTFYFLIPRLLNGSMLVSAKGESVSVSDLFPINSLNIFYVFEKSSGSI